jgi:hypothetical protein
VEAVTAKLMDFSARSRARMPFAEEMTIPTSTIEPRDDPKPISGSHADS